jgi:glycosyltransferase 2 family protein
VLSILMHLLSVGAVVLIAAALGTHAEFAGSVGIMAAATLLSAVPISINGWGVREGTLVAGFSLLGISESVALSISLLFGLCVMLSTLPGCLFWFGKGSERETVRLEG